MYRYSVLFFCICNIFADGFITRYEYAHMLYSNPRGIGCNKCHGAKGEGSLLGVYKKRNGEEVRLFAPPIYNISKEQFYNGFKKRNSVMPNYFLTDEEKESLYLYISGQLEN